MLNCFYFLRLVSEIIKTFLHRYVKETGHVPWSPCFWRIKLFLAFYVEGHLVTITAKFFFLNLTTGFKKMFKDSYIGKTGHTSWRQCFLTDQFVVECEYDHVDCK